MIDSDCKIKVVDSIGNSRSLTINTFDIDTTSPTISQVTAVTSPTNDSTPSYVFSSNEIGTISYGGSCSSSTSSASVGNNNITFNTLNDAIYTNCTITVTDLAGNSSSSLSIDSFRLKTTWTLQYDNGSNSTTGNSIDFDSSGNIYIGGRINNSKLYFVYLPTFPGTHDATGYSQKLESYNQIINIGSISGKRSYPFVAPYTSSKHALAL